ncbi:MAG TPA: phage holin family protein [Anaerolineae bacterium]|nr:phage holin family protein [Anaerolineae bacterium]
MNRSFVYRWLIGGLGLLVADALVPGIHYDGTAVEFIVLALIFGLVNALLKPILAVLTCPLVLLTLGLFMLVINALLLGLTGALGRSLGIPFYVETFGAAFWGGIIISLVGLLGTVFIRDHARR